MVALQDLESRKLDLNYVILSSDSYGSLPVFDAKGHLVDIRRDAGPRLQV